MTLIVIIVMVLLLAPLCLRGGAFHNHLVHRAEATFARAGCRTWLDYPLPLADGRNDFVDLLVHRGNCLLCVESETSLRHVLANAAKADALGLPLWIVVPTRNVKRAVAGRLENTPYRPGGLRIYVLLLSELPQTVTSCFPLFSAANALRENRKTKPSCEKKV